MFSDLALSLSIGIPENRINELHTSLDTLLTVSKMDANTIIGESEKEYLLFLNISFGKGKGELKNIIPAVPG
jgi:hypothetical protein